jgi:hypothetical protein
VVSPTISITPSVPGTCSGAGTSCTVSFQIQVTPPTGVGITNASINFGDGNTAQLGGVSGTVTQSHTYTGASAHGSPTVSVTVHDTLDRDTTGQTSFTLP